MRKFKDFDSMIADMESKYNWWDKLVLHPKMNWLRWTIYNLPDVPRDTYNSIKYFIQRGLRGYSDADVWEVCAYTSDVLANMIKDLNSQVHGYPNKFKSLKQWKRALKEIEWTFKAVKKIDDSEWIRLTDEERKKKDIISLSKRHNIHIMTSKECQRYDKGWDLFKRYFHNLWD